jgi:hypothetical protein
LFETTPPIKREEGELLEVIHYEVVVEECEFE